MRFNVTVGLGLGLVLGLGLRVGVIRPKSQPTQKKGTKVVTYPKCVINVNNCQIGLIGLSRRLFFCCLCLCLCLCLLSLSYSPSY